MFEMHHNSTNMKANLLRMLEEARRENEELRIDMKENAEKLIKILEDKKS